MVDFLVRPDIVVECEGVLHEFRQECDRERTDAIERMGYRVFRVKFAFAGIKGNCHCLANVEVPYTLPDGSILTHRPDIVADIGGLRVGIEVKFRTVTDQFKSRSYDMIHIKRSNPRFYGMMVYVKSHSGISPDHAKSICYPHDHFFSLPETGAQRAENWGPFVQEISRLLN